MKVLIVDDDQAARYLAASIVRSGGHEVVSASDGAEALEVARVEQPDAVLSDILMPKMDGYQLARECKADPALKSVPIVFLTASYTDPADERFALDLGAERFLTKPVEPDVLLDVLAEIAEGTRAEIHARGPRIGEEEILREYSERLVRKLEHKVLELQRSNEMLTAAMEALSSELEVKSGLIRELGGRIDGHEREMASLRAHHELGSAVDGAAVLTVVVGTDGTVRYFGRAAERMTGFEAKEVLGQDWCDLLVPDDDRDRRRAALATLVLAGGFARSRSKVRTGRATTLEVDWMDVCWRDESGDVAGVLAFGFPAG